MTGWRGRLLLCGLTVLAYLLALSGDFVFDDHRFVEENEAIRSLAGPSRFFSDPQAQGEGWPHGAAGRS